MIEQWDHEKAVVTQMELIKTVAALHIDCMPTSILTKYGPSILHSFYKFISSSKHEKLFLVSDFKVNGVAVISFAPQTLMKRFVMGRGINILYEIALKSLMSPTVMKTSIRTILSVKRQPEILDGVPELVLLFVDKHERRKGTATQLIEQIEAFLKLQSISRYYVKTLENNIDNIPISFYKKQGFGEVGNGVESGKNYIFFEKNLIFGK